MAFEDVPYAVEVQLVGTDHSGNATGAHVDPYVRALNTVDSNHHEIHEGHAFTTVKKVTISNGASTSWSFVIPVGLRVHLKPAALSSDGPKITYELYEKPTVSDGTAQTIFNRNRNSALVSGVLIKSGATVSNGDLIDVVYIGGGTGTGATRSGNDASVENEWVLAAGESYGVKVTNGGSAAADVVVSLFWYEHGPDYTP